MKLVRKDNHEVSIVATREMVPASCDFTSAAMVDGKLELSYSGFTDLDWDSQETEERDGQRVFIDEDGDEVLECDIELIEDSDEDEDE